MSPVVKSSGSPTVILPITPIVVDPYKKWVQDSRDYLRKCFDCTVAEATRRVNDFLALVTDDRQQNDVLRGFDKLDRDILEFLPKREAVVTYVKYYLNPDLTEQEKIKGVVEFLYRVPQDSLRSLVINDLDPVQLKDVQSIIADTELLSRDPGKLDISQERLTTLRHIVNAWHCKDVMLFPPVRNDKAYRIQHS